MKPVAVVSTHPIQYQAPLFRYLSEGGVPLHVFFLSRAGLETSTDVGFGMDLAWDIPLLEGYSSEFLSNRKAVGSGWPAVSLLTRLRAERYSAVVIHGIRPLGMVVAALAARVRGIPVLYRAESNLTIAPLSLRRRLFGVLLRRLATICLAIGTENDRFYEALSIPRQRRVLVPYAVDNDRFATETAALGKETARERFRLDPEVPVALFVGKLVPWKRPELLIDAAADVDGLQCLFVGDGPLRAHLQEHASQRCPGRVTLAGFLNQTELSMAYAAADLLVLPSDHEPWGLVVNEAFSCGIPCVVSDRVGARTDLIVPGETGDVFRAGDATDLADKLKRMTSDRPELARMGVRAKERIAAWGFAQDLAGFVEAMEFVKGRYR